jgi:hypothetical protein
LLGGQPSEPAPLLDKADTAVKPTRHLRHRHETIRIFARGEGDRGTIHPKDGIVDHPVVSNGYRRHLW